MFVLNKLTYVHIYMAYKTYIHFYYFIIIFKTDISFHKHTRGISFLTATILTFITVILAPEIVLEINTSGGTRREQRGGGGGVGVKGAFAWFYDFEGPYSSFGK